ncbi:MAG: Phospho-2-dehydro-3-deoxyheptonate aldolase, Phe-sensitive [Pseudomonadota bacterium]|jgi:3-deoxy-7-phosphoheptulonate synthase
MSKLENLRIGAIRALISPQLLLERLPAPAKTQQLVGRFRHEISEVIHARDDRLLVVVGPCSIHHHDEAMEYAQRLKGEADRYAKELIIVMRVYFEKPRTTVGWKGYINDPHLDGSFAINEGLEMARKLLLDILDLELPVGTEFLDLLSPQFFSDLVSWGAIGARTTESQSHRQLASGLSCPVGFKNGTEGSIKVAVDALLAARARHAFIGMTKFGQSAIFETLGNQDCHIILRGGSLPNYDCDSVNAACNMLGQAGLLQRLMIDASHANSSKDHVKQITVSDAIATQIAKGSKSILGLMLESHLAEGRQDLVPGTPLRKGVSITDACLSFEQTRPLLARLAEAVQSRKSAAPT